MKKWVFCLILTLLISPVWAGVDFESGGGDILNCGNDSSIDSLTTFTISFWAFIDTLPTSGNYWSTVVQRDTTQRLFFHINGDSTPAGKPKCDVSTDGTSGSSSVSSAASTSTWTHYVCTYDDAGDRKPYIFIDGVDDTVNINAAIGTIRDGTNINISIGNRSTATPDRPFDGKITEAAIWNVVLNQQEITQLAKSRVKRLPLQIRPSSLKAYWPLDDEEDGSSADGDTFIDMSGNGNTCTGDDGTNNTGLTAKAEEVLSYP